MENLADYVRNIFALYIILTVVDNLVTNEKYGRYIRLFCGILMIIVVLKPAAAFFKMEALEEGNLFSEGYGVSEEVYIAIMEAEKNRDRAVIDAYCAAVGDTVAQYAEGWGYEAQETQVEINLDTESEDYGKVVLIRTQLLKQETGGVNGADGSGSFAGYDIISIKNNLANFYNIPVSNIYITVQNQQDYKEGAK